MQIRKTTKIFFMHVVKWPFEINWSYQPIGRQEIERELKREGLGDLRSGNWRMEDSGRKCSGYTLRQDRCGSNREMVKRFADDHFIEWFKKVSQENFCTCLLIPVILVFV